MRYKFWKLFFLVMPCLKMVFQFGSLKIVFDGFVIVLQFWDDFFGGLIIGLEVVCNCVDLDILQLGSASFF